MSEEHYLRVRKLLSKNKIEEAEKIQLELSTSTGEFSKEEKYWFNLLLSEIRKFYRDYESSKEYLENAFQLAEGIELNDSQKGRVGWKRTQLFAWQRVTAARKFSQPSN